MATRFVSPTGSGTLCTTGSPGAIAQIGLQAVPGDIWMLKNGTYSASGSVLFLDGNAGVTDGTPSSHIRVTAENPGLAILQGNGASGHVLRVNNLSYWDFDNLIVRNANNPSHTAADASICGTFAADNLTFKKCVFTDGNTYGNNPGVTIQGQNILVEDCDCLRNHRNFMQAFGTSTFGITFRRCYISQPVPNNSPSGGPPDGFVFYSAHDCRMENCIAEGISGYGFTGWGNNNSNYGCIALNCNDGGLFNGAASSIASAEGDNFICKNFLAINIVSGAGVYLRPPHATMTNFTCLGCRVIVDANFIDGGTANVTLGNALVKDYPSGSGFSLNQSAMTFATKLLKYSQEWNTTGITGGWTLSNTPPNPPGDVNPNIGSYQISVPNTGAFKGKGEAGADVGANIIYAYSNGTLTGTVLWDFANNRMAFSPPVVAGVNDASTGNVRHTIGARLNLTVDEVTPPPGDPPPEEQPPPAEAPAAPSGTELGINRMITAKLSFGANTVILSGLTFSTESEQIHVIHGSIAALTASSQIMHLYNRSTDNNQMVHVTSSENLTADTTLALVIQAATIDSIDYLEGRYAGLKNVVVELIP